MTTVRFIEPTAARYIYVDANNRVLVFIPIIGGQEISTDNTCKSVIALQTCMGFKATGAGKNPHKSLSQELLRYRNALESDLKFLLHNNPIKISKKKRLRQINEYIRVINYLEEHPDMQSLAYGFPNYPQPIRELIERRSNLFGMILRPEKLDHYIRVTNPVFSVNRHSNQVFYEAIENSLQTLTIQYAATAKEDLSQFVSHQLIQNRLQRFNNPSLTTAKNDDKKFLAKLLSKDDDFETIREMLKAKVKEWFSVDIDFMKGSRGETVTKDLVDATYGLNDETPAETEDYIAGLISYCIPGAIDPHPASKYTAIKAMQRIVVSELKNGDNFAKICATLTATAKDLFNVDIDFSHATTGPAVTQDLIDSIYGYNDKTPATTEDYVNALITYCTPSHLEVRPTSKYATTPSLAVSRAELQAQSPFYANKEAEIAVKREQTSILTQFFLGIINIYCYANDLTTTNFGKVFDTNKNLSKEIADLVNTTLRTGNPVETILINFINNHSKEFDLPRPLVKNEINAAVKMFLKLYKTIDGSEHYDDFSILYNKPGIFRVHQAAICANLAVIIKQGYPLLNSDFIKEIGELNSSIPHEVPNTNECVNANYQIKRDEMLALSRERQQELITEAVKKNDIAFLQYCVEIGLDLHFENQNMNTLIHIAAQNTADPTATINYLRNTVGINLFEKNDQGRTALHYLAIVGHKDLFASVHEHLQDKDSEGYTPIHYAAENGYGSIIELIPNHMLSQPNFHGLRPVHLAAQQGHIHILQILQTKGVDLSETTVPLSAFENGASAIYCATYNDQWDAACFLVTAERNPRKKWRNFIELSRSIFQYHNDNRGDCIQSAWFSPEKLKDIIEIGIARKKLLGEHLWIAPDADHLAAILWQLNAQNQASLLQVLGKNFLQFYIKSVAQFNKISKKLVSAENKKLLLHLIDKNYMFTILKSAVQNNDLRNLQIYQKQLGDLHTYKEPSTQCTLAHYAVKDRPDFDSDKCTILSIEDDIESSFDDVMQRHKVKAAYLITADEVFYYHTGTKECTVIKKNLFIAATRTMTYNVPLSENELNDIQALTQHSHMTTKKMLAFLCSRSGKIKVAEKDATMGNSVVHYAVSHPDLMLSLMNILPTRTFLQKNKDKNTPDENRHTAIQLLINNADTVDSTQKCYAILKHVLKRLPPNDARALLQDCIQQTLRQRTNLRLICLLLLTLGNKNARWEQFNKIITHLVEKRDSRRIELFLATLGAKNMQLIIQAGIEKNIIASMSDAEKNILADSNSEEVIQTLNKYITSNIFNINHIDKRAAGGETVLHHAAKNDFTGLTFVVLKKCGFDFKSVEMGMQVIRQAAIAGNYWGCFYLCKQYGLAIITKNIVSPVLDAVAHGHWELVAFMLSSIQNDLTRRDQETKLIHFLKPLDDDKHDKLRPIIKYQDILENALENKSMQQDSKSLSTSRLSFLNTNIRMINADSAQKSHKGFKSR